MMLGKGNAAFHGWTQTIIFIIDTIMMGIMLKIIKSHNLLVKMGQGLQQEMFPEVGQGVEAVWGGGRDVSH